MFHEYLIQTTKGYSFQSPKSKFYDFQDMNTEKKSLQHHLGIIM